MRSHSVETKSTKIHGPEGSNLNDSMTRPDTLVTVRKINNTYTFRHLNNWPQPQIFSYM